MRAIILATEATERERESGECFPNCLLPLVDRAFIQHVVEYLVDQKVCTIDFVLSHLPEKFESLFGDGSRWGCRFQFHLAREGQRPYQLVRAIASACFEPVLVAHADHLPEVHVRDCVPEIHQPVVICSDGGARPVWTGWACFKPQDFTPQSDHSQRDDVAEALIRRALEGSGRIVLAPRCLKAQSPADLLRSQRLVLSKQFPGLLQCGREAQEGIWIGRNVVLHPTARLEAPVYVGENSRIGAGVLLGPNTVIVGNTILERHCSVLNAAVLSRSYVGEGLHLEHVIVDRNKLISTDTDERLHVTDSFLLDSLTHSPIRDSVRDGISRLVGLQLLILTLPLLLLTMFVRMLARSRPFVYKAAPVQLPATGGPGVPRRVYRLYTFSNNLTGCGIRDCLLRVLPGLWNVAKGDLHLVGVPPRTEESIAALPHDWRALYLTAKAGLIHEAGVLYNRSANPDEMYSAEAFYAAVAGPKHDLRLLGLYLSRLFSPVQAKAGK